MQTTVGTTPGFLYSRFYPTILRAACGVLALAVTGLGASAAEPVDYSAAIQRLEQTVQTEIARGLISGVTVALVDDQRLVYTRGFGFADKRCRGWRKSPAS